MRFFLRYSGLVFKTFWKLITLTRIAIMNVLFLGLFIGIIYLVYTNSGISKSKTKSALILDLSGPIIEQSRYDKAVNSFSSVIGNERENILFELVDSIRHAKDDNQISGIVLALDAMREPALNKLRYIAKALKEFKTSGKPIYAIGNSYNQGAYYLASYADKIHLSPGGYVLIKGYGTQSIYFKTLMEKLDISTHVFRVGTYKSAVEPIIRDDMSEEARKSASRWLNQLWDAFIDDIAKNRQIETAMFKPTEEELLSALQSTNGDIEPLLIKFGLIDKVSTNEELNNEFSKIFGERNNKYNSISYYEYLKNIPSRIGKQSDPGIAVIVADGVISSDEQASSGIIKSQDTISLIKKARFDDTIKAVVLRLNSPGGSAFASEMIEEEIEALRKNTGKPFIVSMSSVAASGGYLISSGADKILADQTTLTGSIGVYSVLTTIEKLLAKAGIHADGVETHPFANLSSMTSISKSLSDVIQIHTEHVYNQFLNLVSKHRNMTIPEVDAIAQGRVWTGKDAMKFGLIDQIGDFDDAINLAAELAQIENYRISWLRKDVSTKKIVRDILRNIGMQLGWDMEIMLPKAIYPLKNTQLVDNAKNLLKNMNDPKGQYAFCLECQVL
ncbi:protease 4 [Candidatus Photodesmus katoptron]|uniref:signal peptide peptidase SppA n=1 Tax=Candidatus Photodesmus anomalopis TaxID=28176 RepID=UPI0004D6C0BD|nr:signal peptide peptidase SppA [Candidatus Photodesmus katoptron]KEY90518.1 protease 4 [Candidatus Photodesmus katoptron]